MHIKSERLNLPSNHLINVPQGRGIVSQEFRLLKWKAISLDIDVNSNATMVEDILNIEPEDLAFVPDFMWASLPCHTYSRAAGAKHRCAKKGDYEKTQEACDNNFLFTKMVEIMNWAKQKHPHCIVAIENPVGQLAFMPLMVRSDKIADSCLLLLLPQQFSFVVVAAKV